MSSARVTARPPTPTRPAARNCRSSDRGELLRAYGLDLRALQYEIGNPVTASRMTRYRLPAALYAPLRVVLYADEQGRAVFEYDKPHDHLAEIAGEGAADGEDEEQHRVGEQEAAEGEDAAEIGGQRDHDDLADQIGG